MFDSLSSNGTFDLSPAHGRTEIFHDHLEGASQNIPFTHRRASGYPPNTLYNSRIDFNPNEHFPVTGLPVSYERIHLNEKINQTHIEGKNATQMHSHQRKRIQNYQEIEQERVYQESKSDLMKQLPNHNVLTERLNPAAYAIADIPLKEWSEGLLSIARESISRGTYGIDLDYFISASNEWSAAKIRDGGKDNFTRDALLGIALTNAQQILHHYLASSRPVSQ
jgi:hypothetical protein